MSGNPSSLPSPGAPPARSSRAARAILAVSVGVVTVWLGIRVAQAVQAKRTGAPGTASSSPTQRSPREGVRGVPEPWQPDVAVEGTLLPIRETDLGFTTGGRLARVSVRVGAHVERGAQLAALDGSMAEAQRRAADAQIRAAAAQLALADDAERRATGLVERGAVSESAGVAATKQRDLARAQLDQAKAQKDLAGVVLSHHVITAPFGGTVTAAPSAPGAVVGPGVPLFHLVDTSMLRLVGTVSELESELLRAGQAVEVAAQGKVARGTVTAVLPAADPQTRRVRFEAELDNGGPQPVVAGVLARGAVKTSAPREVLRFPGAVVRPGTQDEVFVKAGDGWRATRVALVPVGESVIVRHGLSRDDLVLLSPPPLGSDP